MNHYVYEIVLQGVFFETKLFIYSSPNIPLFKKFKKNCCNIEKLDIFTFKTDNEIYEQLKDVVPKSLFL